MDAQALIPCAGAALLAWLMLRAGASKLWQPRRHARLIDAYALLPAGTGAWLAPLLGAMECAAALLVWLPALRFCAAATTFLLLLVYTAAIAINLYRGHRDIDCGCAGSLRHQPLGAWLLARNAVLVLAATLPLLQPQAWPQDALTWIAAIVVATLAVLLYNAVDFFLSRDSHFHDD